MKHKLMFALTVMMIGIGVFALSAQGAKTQWDGVYTAEQATRGAATYKAKCAACHGDSLAGFVMESNPAPALTGADFEKSWDDFPVSDLYEKIKTLMPQDDPGILTPAQASEVVAFIYQFNKYPAGSTELPGDVEQLKMIKFLAKKPGA